MKLLVAAMIVRMILTAFDKNKVKMKEGSDTSFKAETRDPAAFRLR